MRPITLSAAMALLPFVSAAPTIQSAKPSSSFTFSASYTAGFQNPTIQSSIGGQATCISGFINITASASNVLINMSSQGPANQSALTELIVEAVQINSTSGKQLVSGLGRVSGTFGIYSELCFPKSTNMINKTAVQFLIHGSGFDRAYWNAAPVYSYVDYAAERGYTTFSYDRLGTGLSDHPDPVQIVQAELQLEIGHKLIQLLRAGAVAGQPFEHVIGVGHSFGSFQVQGITAQYPHDFNAVVLTGFSTDMSGMAVAFSGLGLSIASEVVPLRFAGLANGYWTTTSMEASQFFFLRAPGFDPKIAALAESIKQIITLGEYLTTSSTLAVTNFTGPIDVVNGENDLPNCHGNCLVPYNKVATVKDAYYPAASNGSSWYLAPGVGHGVNFHYGATLAYEHIHDFLRTNGF